MTESFNWNEIEKNAGGDFTPMAEVGTHEATVETVDVRETKNAQGNNSYWLDIIFQEDSLRFPKISHPISFKNANWRRWHFMLILTELGIPEEKAKLAIESAEKKPGEENIVAAYHAMFDRATQKHPAIKIEVYEDTNLNPKTGRPYMRADFKNPRISFGNKPQKTASVVQSIFDEATDVAEEEQINLEDLGL